MAQPADREARDLILTALNDSPGLLPAAARPPGHHHDPRRE